MTWAERVCEGASVATMTCILGYVVVRHVRYERAGEMEWASVRWRNLVCDQSGRSAALAAIRLSMSAYVLVTTVVMACTPVHDSVPGRPAVSGARMFCTLTVWSWALIGVYCGVAGVASAMHSLGATPPEGRSAVLVCSMWVLFETMFATSIMVFFLVWLVLVPAKCIKDGGPGRYFHWTTLSAHNLNLVFMIIECVRNGFHFRRPHFVFTMYYGATYVVFSWFWFLHSGVFFYFFIDWRKALTPFWYLGVVGVVYVSFDAGVRLARRVKPQVGERPGLIHDRGD